MEGLVMGVEKWGNSEELDHGEGSSDLGGADLDDEEEASRLPGVSPSLMAGRHIYVTVRIAHESRN